MIVGHSQKNNLHWHALIDGYLLCQREIMAKINTITEYTPNMYMCQRCEASLYRIDSDWRDRR